MTDTVAIDDLRIGMHIHLDLGWMAHPFPVSSFRIETQEQIQRLRALGIPRLRWSPSLSTTAAAPSAAAQAPTDVPALASAPSPADAAAQRRRLALQSQRAALQQLQHRYGEVGCALAGALALVHSQPREAHRQAEVLAHGMADAILDADELHIRSLPLMNGERSQAHALNSSVLSMLLARALDWPPPRVRELGLGALLHDIGKLDLPARVHHAEDCRTAAEKQAWRDHVLLGVKRLRTMGASAAVLQMVGQHHEQADGKGFPLSPAVGEISPAAGIVALVNHWDNLCNPAPGAPATTPHEALALLFAQHRHRHDGALLEAFVRMMGVYPAGSVVQLSDERFAVVTAVNPRRPLRPQLLVHDCGVPRDEALLLDLEQQPGLSIRRSLQAAMLPAESFRYLMPRPRVAYYFDAERCLDTVAEVGT